MLNIFVWIQYLPSCWRITWSSTHCHSPHLFQNVDVCQRHLQEHGLAASGASALNLEHLSEPLMLLQNSCERLNLSLAAHQTSLALWSMRRITVKLLAIEYLTRRKSKKRVTFAKHPLIVSEISFFPLSIKQHLG